MKIFVIISVLFISSTYYVFSQIDNGLDKIFLSKNFCHDDYRNCIGEDLIVLRDGQSRKVYLTLFLPDKKNTKVCLKDSLISSGVQENILEPINFSFLLTLDDLKKKELDLTLSIPSIDIYLETKLPLGYKRITIYVQEGNPILKENGFNDNGVINISFSNHYCKNCK